MKPVQRAKLYTVLNVVLSICLISISIVAFLFGGYFLTIWQTLTDLLIGVTFCFMGGAVIFLNVITNKVNL